MQLRRFTADTTPAALGAVRMAFGDDALILANRRKGDQVEIIATSSAEDVSVLEQFMAQEEQDASLRAKSAASARRQSATVLDEDPQDDSQIEVTEDESRVATATATQTQSATATATDTDTDTDIGSDSNRRPAKHKSTRRAQGSEHLSSISELSRDINSIDIDEPALRLEGSEDLKPDTVELSARQETFSTTAPDRPGKTLEQVNEEAMQAAATVLKPREDELHSSDINSAIITDAVTAAVQGAVQAAVQDAVQSAVQDTVQNAVQEALRGVVTSTETESMKLLSGLCDAIDSQRQSVDNRFKSLEVNLWGDQAPERSQHLRKMFSLGIGAELAVRLVERIEPETPVDDAVRRSLALLKSTLPIGSDKSLSEAGVTVFSGPAGGGKTTALFKLATQYVKQFGNQSIVIIGADTRRIGAFEELQAYGKLLGVPTVQANDSNEFERMLGAFSHKTLILVDHGLVDNGVGVAIPESNSSATAGLPVRELFVLPANMQAVTVDDLITRHCSNRSVQCVLTHLDTCARLGELFNSIIRHHLPVAYFSDTQSVQVPLEKADASVLVATAVSMGQGITASADDEWLQRLIQPSRQLLNDPVLKDDTVKGARS